MTNDTSLIIEESCARNNSFKVNKLEKFQTEKNSELISELRIAKEVSVRLHNELEAAEDKR